MLALPSLAHDSTVVATIVIEPYNGAFPLVLERPPEGFDGQVAFDVRRAVRGLWPAIDPARTTSSWYPTDRHERLAATARTLLADYSAMDCDLQLPDPSTLPAPECARAAQELVRLLAQPFKIAEPFTSRPGEVTPYASTLDAVEAIVTRL